MNKSISAYDLMKWKWKVIKNFNKPLKFRIKQELNFSTVKIPGPGGLLMNFINLQRRSISNILKKTERVFIWGRSFTKIAKWEKNNPEAKTHFLDKPRCGHSQPETCKSNSGTHEENHTSWQRWVHPRNVR